MHEIENYIDPILDGKLIGENYRDILDTQKDEWQVYIDQITAKLQNGKISMEKYLEFVMLGQKTQTELLAKARTKKASKTTINRIVKRLELLKGEIRDVKEQMGQPMDVEELPAKQEPIEEEPKVKKEEKKEAEAPKKPKFKVPEEKLEQLSKKLNQYKHFLVFCLENKITDNNALMAKVKDIKDLFKNPLPSPPNSTKVR